MTDLQKSEFALLQTFVSVCDQLRLPYYLVCGSALGAVKYHGFIPWDDDIDVALLRPDYECFLEKAPALLPDHCFLQNYHTEAAFPQIYSKLRDSTTTYVEAGTSRLPIHHGVYIDIFPLDGAPESEREQQLLERKIVRLKRRLSCAFEVRRSFREQILFRMRRLFRYHRNTRRYVQQLTSLITQWETNHSPVWCNHGNWQGELEYAPREQYGSGAWATFEGLRVRIPEQYDAYLAQKYGDWRADLPEAEKHSHHTAEIVDLHRPYTDYWVDGKGFVNRKDFEI